MGGGRVGGRKDSITKTTDETREREKKKGAAKKREEKGARGEREVRERRERKRRWGEGGFDKVAAPPSPKGEPAYFEKRGEEVKNF